MTRKQLVSATEPGADFLYSGAICRSPRMLSRFGDTQLRIDVSPKVDGSIIWVRNLANVSLSMWGSRAHAQSTIDLLSLRYAAHWAYLAVAAELERRQVHTRLSHCISSAFNSFHRFCVWMARRGVVDLKSIGRADTDALLDDLRLRGEWSQLLGEDHAYSALIQRIAKDEDAKSLVSSITKLTPKGFSFSEAPLSRVLGFPVHSGRIPKGLSDAVAEVLGVQRGSLSQSRYQGGFARRTLRGVLTYVNDLARVGDKADGRFGLAFVPFSNPVHVAARSISRLPTSFQNMALEDVIALLRECQRWVDQYADGIIKFYQELGEKMAELSARHSDSSTVSLKLAQHVRTVSPRYQVTYGLPAIHFPWRAKRDRSMSDLVRTLQAACAVLVLVNHGRRNNEVFGEASLSYGLYLGCLSQRDFGDVSQYEIRVYIEKTVRDWALMSANSGVAKAVGILEKLLEAGCKVSERMGVSDRSLRLTGEGRPKLFQAVPLAISKQERLPSMFIWHDHSRWLFELAGVDPANCHGQTHPFRRFFAQVYYYRFENADIRALSQWLGHANIGNTLIYVTDPASRANAERIEALHRQANEVVASEIRAFGHEYLNDCLVRLLEGTPSGGGFTSLALRVFRAMSSRVSFPSDTAARARALTEWFTERGYAPESHPHAACMAGTNSLSKFRSKCYDAESKTLRKDEASASKCSGCPHAFVNDGYLASDLEEVARLAVTAADDSLPGAVRTAAKDAENHLRATMMIEEKLLGASRGKLQAIYDKIATELDAANA